MLPVMDSRQALTTKTVENRTSVPSKSRKLFYVKRISNTRRCSVFFSDLSRAERKIVDGQYFCNICGNSFNNVSDLDAHVSNHSMEDPFSCGLCKMPFWELSDLENHVRSHKGKKLFECEIVDLLENLGAWSNLKIESVPVGNKEHERLFSENLDEFSTAFPDMPFLYDSESVNTEVFRDNVNDESDECFSYIVMKKELIEDAIIETSAAKEQGKEAAVGDEDENAEENLGEIFDESQDPGDLDSVELHLDSVELPSSSEITSLQCKICLRVFPDLRGFTKHRDYHRNMGEYKCHICDKAFHCKAFKQHIKSHSVEASSIEMGQLDLAAEEQGKETGVAAETEEDSSMILDESQNPGDVGWDEPLSNSEISLQCKTCLRVFPHVKGFMRHHDYHRNMGEYKCHICDKAFHCKEFKLHMRAHTLEAASIKMGQLDSAAEEQGKDTDVAAEAEENLSLIFGESQDPNDVSCVEPLISREISRLQCRVCLRVFPHLKAFTKHHDYHRHKGEYKCHVCDKAFHRQAFRVHMRTHYEEAFDSTTGCLDSSVFVSPLEESDNGRNGIHTCHLCKIGFADLEELKQHSFTHAKERPYICEVCGHCFTTRTYLNVHLKEHDLNKKDKCQICGKGFTKPSRLARHLITHSIEKPFKCEICEAAFSCIGYLHTHRKKHGISRIFKCSDCGLSFDKFAIFQEHRRGHIYTEHICEVCGKSFAHKYSHKVHIQTHETNTKTQCKICDKVLKGQLQLRIHMLLHSKPCSYQCDLCGHSFRNMAGLKIHRQRHAGDKPHKCKFCDKAFVLTSEVTVHERIHTGNKPYKCKICDRKFIRFNTHKDHMRTHTGEKPHSCKICGKEFSYRKDMLQHVRIHTGEKPYKCLLCGSKFRIWTMLKEHFAKVHPEEGPLMPEPPPGALKTLKRENKLYEIVFKMTTSDDEKVYQNNTKIKTKKRSSKKKAWISDTGEEDPEPSTDEMESAVDSVDTGKTRASGDHRQTRTRGRSGQTQCKKVGPEEFCCGVCLKKFKTRDETIIHYSQHQ